MNIKQAIHLIYNTNIYTMANVEILLDVTEKSHPPHYPMFATNVTFKVNSSNIVGFCSSWFSVYWTLIQRGVFTRGAVDGINVQNRNRLIQDLGLGLHQPSSLLIKTSPL